MKYAVFTLALLTLACTKKEAPSEAPPAEGEVALAEAAPAEAEPAVEDTAEAAPVETAPVIELIDAGKPPLRTLRWEFKEGAREVLKIRSAYTWDAEAKGIEGGRNPPKVVLPAIIQTIHLDVGAVSDFGVAGVDFEVREERTIEASDVPRAQLHITATKGAKGSYKVDSAGVISDFRLTPPPELPSGENVEHVEDLLRMTVFPLPAQPVGIGARWTVARTAKRRGMSMNEQVTLELVELADSDIAIRFELESSGTTETDIGSPQAAAVKKETHSWNAVGRTQSTLVSPSPRSTKMLNVVGYTSQVERPDRELEEFNVTIERKVEMKRQ